MIKLETLFKYTCILLLLAVYPAKRTVTRLPASIITVDAKTSKMMDEFIKLEKGVGELGENVNQNELARLMKEYEELNYKFLNDRPMGQDGPAEEKINDARKSISTALNQYIGDTRETVCQQPMPTYYPMDESWQANELMRFYNDDLLALYQVVDWRYNPRYSENVFLHNYDHLDRSDLDRINAINYLPNFNFTNNNSILSVDNNARVNAQLIKPRF